MPYSTYSSYKMPEYKPAFPEINSNSHYQEFKKVAEAPKPIDSTTSAESLLFNMKSFL